MKEDVCMMTSQPDRDVVNETDKLLRSLGGSSVLAWNLECADVLCDTSPLLVTIALTGDSAA